ncbi:ATP-binding protein [Mycolicibacterium sp. XJ1819]
MSAGLASRPREQAAVAEFLDTAVRGPSALLIEGVAGIGKTTLWLATLDEARARGFQVLSTRAAEAESVLAYGALADMLCGVDPAAVGELPKPQRAAMQQMLAAGTSSGPPTDQRAVAAAFLSIVQGFAADGPVLLAVDDLQWLDPSSAHVLGYAARRLSGPVGVLGAVRTDDEGGDTVSWLQLRRPDAVHRIAMRPLSSRALLTVVAERLGRPVSRTKMARILEVSGGNPFYAIELARAAETSSDGLLPNSLAELVRARIEGLGPEVQEALLAAACLATPSVELVEDALGSGHDRVVESLEAAEHQGVIAIEGNRVRFTHPLLAAGVYTNASETQRRSMHRRLADVVDETELRARHLALAATEGDPQTVQALDEAAIGAHTRGAPVAAAELLELAIGLGGDTDERRIRLAIHTFDGGDPGRARTLLEQVIAGLSPGPLRAEALYLLAVVQFIDDGYLEASELLRQAVDEDAAAGPTQVRMLTTLAFALYMIGDSATAWRRAEEAVAEAERLGDPGLLSQALGVRVTMQFFTGGGIDEPSLRRALELEDRDSFTPVMLRPSVEHALILSCTGDLDTSYDLMRSIERDCIDGGEEGELVFVDFYVALNRIWRADLAEARRQAHGVTELARHLGGGFPAMLSLVLQAWIAVYDGSEDEARLAVSDAIDACKRSGTLWHEESTITALGFLEVSLGNHTAAVSALAPLMSRHVPESTEISAAAYLPDAVEALVALDRWAEAEPFVDALERNGRRLNRAWMLAVGARGRAMVHAAQGHLDEAIDAATQAMAHHDEVPMPFERARTELLLGQLQQRRREPAAEASLRNTLAVFDQLRIPLWAKRAREHLSGAGATAQPSAELTTIEQRVADLAASGLTNKDVAEALFVSAKTVEAALARVYRKLGIQSRAQLGRAMRETGG